ncbi:MAG: phosphohydrolase [Flavobacteriales bacterium]|nr:phosphohydrolase [Flavobacteriales bacterium]MBP7408256.1 phosphohydrolase [Flavobacteriales bacterium]
MDHLLETAIRLAAKVHKGQVDRSGKPYVLHVMRVMERGQDFDEQVLGALHDVLERSDLTIADIEKKGFSPRVLKALDRITRRAEETYEQYIDRVVEDSLAIRVKLNDLADKMDLRHVEQLDESDLKRYNKQLTAYHRMKKLVEMAKARMSVPVESKSRN